MSKTYEPTSPNGVDLENFFGFQNIIIIYRKEKIIEKKNCLI